MPGLANNLAIAARLVAGAVRCSADDSNEDSAIEAHNKFAHELGSRFVSSPDARQLQEIINQVDQVSPSPGVPEEHQVIEFSKSQNKFIASEIELAYQFEQLAPTPRPMIAVTGTDGKTTTTLMAAAILSASGLRAMAVGNTELPLIASLSSDAQAFAVECSK